MSTAVRSFDPGEVEEAARLVADRFRRLRARSPLLPVAWENPARFAALLSPVVESGPAVVAVEGGRIVGFLAAHRGGDQGGRNGWTWSPEWANGAALDDDGRIIEALYGELAAVWVAEGHRTHTISVFIDDAAALHAWDWLGFGASMIDALRSAEALEGVVEHVAVRRAGTEDLDALVRLEGGLRSHLAASPTFFRLPPPRATAQHLERLADPTTPILFAEIDGSPVAYMRIGPSKDDAATVIRDEGTASISGAFTEPRFRRGGIATAILDAGLAWAREQGMIRVAVDFESMNVLAARFWTRTFDPVVISLTRRIPGGHEESPA